MIQMETYVGIVVDFCMRITKTEFDCGDFLQYKPKKRSLRTDKNGNIMNAEYGAYSWGDESTKVYEHRTKNAPVMNVYHQDKLIAQYQPISFGNYAVQYQSKLGDIVVFKADMVDSEKAGYNSFNGNYMVRKEKKSNITLSGMETYWVYTTYVRPDEWDIQGEDYEETLFYGLHEKEIGLIETTHTFINTRVINKGKEKYISDTILQASQYQLDLVKEQEEQAKAARKAKREETKRIKQQKEHEIELEKLRHLQKEKIKQHYIQFESTLMSALDEVLLPQAHRMKSNIKRYSEYLSIPCNKINSRIDTRCEVVKRQAAIMYKETRNENIEDYIAKYGKLY